MGHTFAENSLRARIWKFTVAEGALLDQTDGHVQPSVILISNIEVIL